MTKAEVLAKLTKDLELRGRSEDTVKLYTANAAKFLDYHGKPANQMGENEISDFLHHLTKEGSRTVATVNVYNSALRFLYGVTLDYTLNYKKLPRLKQNRKLPQLYTKAEVVEIIESADSLIHTAMLMLAYGSGLRLSEITNLKISDIESAQMRILIRSGKGNRDRYAMLPQSTLDTLREYWKMYRPKDWLFEAPRLGGQYRERTLQDAFKAALLKSGIKKPGTIHTLRHCYATHLYEDGHSLLAIKKLMGHIRIDTTAWYTQLACSDILALKSPLDNSLSEKYGNPRNVLQGGGNTDA